jgi:hypothetical protein
VLGRELPLDDHVGAPQRDARIVEQRPQDRRRGGERQVRHDRERLFGPCPTSAVRFDHPNPREPAPQFVREGCVAFDRDHARAGALERRGQRTASGAQVHDEVPGHNPGLANERLGEAATPEEVLPAWTDCRRPSNGHASPSWSRDDRTADESRVIPQSEPSNPHRKDSTCESSS